MSTTTTTTSNSAKSVGVAPQEIVECRQSFTFQAWKRLKNVCMAIRQTEEKVQRLKREIEQKFKNTERLREKRAELQSCRMLILSLNGQLERRRTATRTIGGKLNKARYQAADYRVRLEAFAKELDALGTALIDKRRLYVESREKLIWSVTQLLMRRRQMVQEVVQIFFIENHSQPTSLASKNANSDQHCSCQKILKIVNVHLPDAENLSGHNDGDIVVGFCYIVQVMIVLSRLLDMSLRYPLEFAGTRSIIYDHLDPKLADNQKRFQLGLRYQDKNSFQYGVFLINKNIAQLRCDCGLATRDLRCTLGNLGSLLDHLADSKLRTYLHITKPLRLLTDHTTFSGFVQSSSASDLLSSHSDDAVRASSEVRTDNSNEFGSESLSETKNGESVVTLPNDLAGSSSQGVGAEELKDRNYFETDSDTNVGTVLAIDKELLRTCYLTAEDGNFDDNRSDSTRSKNNDSIHWLAEGVS